MDIRNDEDELKAKELDVKYNNLTEEERLVDTLILADDSTKKNEPSSSPKHKLTRADIINSVLEQANEIKRDDITEDVKDELSKTPNWFSEYQKQHIKVNKDRVKVYLECYEDLEDMVKYREANLISGKIKPESKSLEINKIKDFNFLNNSNINKADFYSKVDYKLREMKFYQRNLSILIRNLKMYGFLVYQFISFKYFLKLTYEQIEDLTPFKNLDYLDDIAINFLNNKLIEEARKECQD